MVRKLRTLELESTDCRKKGKKMVEVRSCQWMREYCCELPLFYQEQVLVAVSNKNLLGNMLPLFLKAVKRAKVENFVLVALDEVTRDAVKQSHGKDTIHFV